MERCSLLYAPVVITPCSFRQLNSCMESNLVVFCRRLMCAPPPHVDEPELHKQHEARVLGTEEARAIAVERTTVARKRSTPSLTLGVSLTLTPYLPGLLQATRSSSETTLVLLTSQEPLKSYLRGWAHIFSQSASQRLCEPWLAFSLEVCKVFTFMLSTGIA